MAKALSTTIHIYHTYYWLAIQSQREFNIYANEIETHKHWIGPIDLWGIEEYMFWVLFPCLPHFSNKLVKSFGSYLETKTHIFFCISAIKLHDASMNL